MATNDPAILLAASLFFPLRALTTPARAAIAYQGIAAPTPPVISVTTPASGSTITRTASIAVNVTDDSGSLRYVGIWATLANGTTLTVWDGSAFVGAFATSSTHVGIALGHTYTILHDSPGWASTSVVLHIAAIDLLGAETTATASFTISNPPTAPVISAFDPLAGAIGRTDEVSFTVTSVDGFAKVIVWADLDDGTSVFAYNGTAFSGEVDDASTLDGTTTKAFGITYNGDGWGDDYTLHVLAVDLAGRSSDASVAYTLSDPPAPPDVTTPSVTVISPTPPGPIGRNDAVRVQVTDAGTLLRVKLYVTMGDEQYVVHNGYSFRPRYAVGSTRTAITGGFEYVLLRSGGWLASPTFEVYAIDQAGNER